VKLIVRAFIKAKRYVRNNTFAYKEPLSSRKQLIEYNLYQFDVPVPDTVSRESFLTLEFLYTLRILIS